jgi:CRP/FNR family transcriptional regulator, polysaccharide utilization system transcription regulator
LKTEKHQQGNKDITNNPLLGTSEMDELFRLSGDKSTLLFHKGDILFSENTSPSGVYFLKEGTVRVYNSDTNGNEQTLGIIAAGHYIDLGSLIRNKKHIGSAVALEDSTVCFIPKAEFFSLTAKYPGISHQLLVKFCYQLDKAEDKLVSLSNKSHREKLAETLYLLGRNPGLQSDANSIRITARELATMIGTTADKVDIYLSEFVDKKIIDTFGDQIKIICMESLEKICNANT